MQRVVLGVDLGYGYDKGVSSANLKKFIERAVVGSAKDLTLNAMHSSANTDDIHVEVERDGKKRSYFVGDLARRESYDARYTMDENKIDHENTQILLATACAALWPVDNSPVHLVTGLPMSHYKQQKSDFEKILKDFRARVQIHGRHHTPLNISFAGVTVFPQGYGAAYAAILNENGTPKNPELLNSPGLIVLVDPGQKTTEVVTFETKPKFRPIDSLSFGINMGGDDVVRAMSDVFKTKAGAPLPKTSEDFFVKEGHMFYSGTTIDARHELAQVRAQIGNTIMERVKAGLGDSAPLVHTVFLAGGNYRLIHEQFKAFCRQTHVVEDPQFANANGYRIIGEVVEKQRVAALYQKESIRMA